MPNLHRENVFETSISTGTGNFTLAGAVTGARTFQSAFSAGAGDKPCFYKMRNAVEDGTFEVGICMVNGTTLKRSTGTVLESSNSNALVDWGAGTKNVWCEIPALFADRGTEIINAGVAGGTANAITVSPNVPLIQIDGDVIIYWRAPNTNSGATTFTPSGLGATALQQNGAALEGGEVQAGGYYGSWRKGSSSNWQLIQIDGPRHPTVARSSNTELGVTDAGRTFIATSTFTQTFSAAATLGKGWGVYYRNDGTGVITLDPNGAETIDGSSTLALQPGESCKIVCDGAAFKTIGLERLKVKVGKFTRDISTATGTQAVTGVGFKPKSVKFIAAVDLTSMLSIGFDDGTTANCVTDRNNISASVYSAIDGSSIYLIQTGANQYQGSVSSFDADGMTISWLKTGSTTGTATIYYMAEG